MNEKQKKNLVKDCNKLFKLKEEYSTTEEDKIKEEDLKGYMDSSNVAMLIPLKKRFKEFLVNNFDVSEEKVPQLDYSQDSKQPNIKCKYSCEYLNILLNLTKYYESLTIETKNDYPLRVTTEDFIFILAPRVDND